MKAAVSRLPAGPETDRMEVTDIETGRFVFAPVPGEPIRYASLREVLEGAGYEMTAARMTATARRAPGDHLEVLGSGQVLVLAAGPGARRLSRTTAAGDTVSVHGEWRPGPEADTLAVREWARGTEVPEIPAGEGGP